MIYIYNVDNRERLNIKKLLEDCGNLFSIKDVRQDLRTYKITITTEIVLNDEQKSQLDSFVETAKGFVYSEIIVKSTNEILNDIFEEISSEDQKNRIINALNKYPTFVFSLNDKGYVLAKEILDIALSNEDINNEDHYLILSKLP